LANVFELAAVAVEGRRVPDRVGFARVEAADLLPGTNKLNAGFVDLGIGEWNRLADPPLLVGQLLALRRGGGDESPPPAAW